MTHTNTRVNEIDLLRFFAASSVVLYHYAFRGHAANSWSVLQYPLLASIAKYGYLGVELFFMISGFVILMTAANGSLRGFVISRIVRLYPAFWICCTATFAMTVAIGAPFFTASIGQYLINLTLLSGFVGVPSIDFAYWSLYVELRFYALVAILLLIGRIHQAQIFIILWLIASVALEFHPIGKLRYLLIGDYSAFFVAGATYFLIWQKGLSSTRIAIIITSWGLAVYQSVNRLVGVEKFFEITMSGYVVTGIITTFFVVMMLVSLRRTGLLGSTRWILAGTLTYPLYLLHQNIGYMIFNAAYAIVNIHLLFWGTILAVLILAYTVHVFVEKPLSEPMKAILNRLTDYVQAWLRRRSVQPL